MCVQHTEGRKADIPILVAEKLVGRIEALD